MKPRKAQFSNLVNPAENLAILASPVSEQYTVDGGWITPNGKRLGNTHPLDDAELFLSFAKLGAGNPSKDRVQRWVNKYGLLTNENRHWDLPVRERFKWVPLEARVIEKPMRLETFKTEARCANQLLNLYADIRARDMDRIVKRFTTPPPRPDVSLATIVDQLMEAYWNSSMGGKGTTTDMVSPRFWFEAAVHVFKEAIFCVMKDVRLEVTDLYWPLDNEPIQTDDMEFGGFSSVPTCRNLLSAIYLQFYLMVTDRKPLRRCEACGEPFPLKRKDKLTCNPTCRSNKRNQRNREERASVRDT